MMTMRVFRTAFLSLLMVAVSVSMGWSLPQIDDHNEGNKNFTILTQSVHVEVCNNLVQTNIVQTIRNNTEEKGYLRMSIPVPARARINSFSAIVNGVLYRGACIDKNDLEKFLGEVGASMYGIGEVEEEVEEVEDEDEMIEEVGKMEFEDKEGAFIYSSYHSLQVDLCQIAPASTVIFQVAYIEQAVYDQGTFSYSFNSIENPEKLTELKHYDMNVSFSCSAEIAEVVSNSHSLEGGISGRDASFVVSDIASKEGCFNLAWNLNLEPGIPYLATKEVEGEDSYFSMLMLPPDYPVIKDGRSIVLLVDKSGSMDGERFELAVEACKRFVDKLNDKDMVNLVMFDTEEYYCAPFPFKADDEGKAGLADFLDSFGAGGGTRFLAPLKTAITTLEFAPGKLPAVVLLSDGRDNKDSAKDFYDALNAYNGFEIPIYSFAIGSGCDEALLRTLAKYSGADLAFIYKEAQLVPGLEKIARAFENIVASKFNVDGVGDDFSDVMPKFKSRIFKGELISVIGRNAAGVSSFSVSAMTSKGYWSACTEFGSPNARHCEFVDQIWAGAKVTDLLDFEDLFGESPELREQIVALSVRYLISTPYTVFVFVADDSPVLRRILGWSGSPTGAYGMRRGGRRRMATKKGGSYPLVNSQYMVCDASGKPLPQQELAHAFLLALAGDKVKETLAKYREMSAEAKQQYIDKGKLLPDLLNISATAYGLHDLNSSNPKAAKAEFVVSELLKLDPVSECKDKSQEYIAMVAYFVSELVKSGKYGIPKSFVESIKGVIETTTMDFSKNPIGSSYSDALKWAEWFPVIQLVADAYDIRFTEQKLHEHLIYLAFRNTQRASFANWDIFFAFALSKLLRTNILPQNLREDAVRILDTKKKSKTEEGNQSIIEDVLKDRTNMIMSL